MCKKTTFFVLPLLCISFCASCSMSSESEDKRYLNAFYSLKYCGDVHGADPFKEEVLNRNNPYDDYIYLFDRTKSYINYQCVGTSFDDFSCIGSIKIVDKKNNVILENESFDCWTNVGLYYGSIVFENKNDKETIGTIYVYAPYWCKIELMYDVNNNSEPILLTFEFWVTQYNKLPDFLGGNQNE